MSTPASNATTSLKPTPLYAEHVKLGSRIVPFAGYAMPVQYAGGILEEHAWTRTRAGLFDISHMGQAYWIAPDRRHETAAKALETLVPADLVDLKPGQQRYTQLINSMGGVIDDLMVTRSDDAREDGPFYLVFNAARKEVDCAHIARHLGVGLEEKPDLALIALQGPKAREVLGSIGPEAVRLGFMQATRTRIAGCDCHVSRSGYTGEDGFEISVRAADAKALWQTLLESEHVRPCGLGARDSLRLEAGICLYGHELDETTSPVEAGLTWSIQKRRRLEGGFPGAERIQREIAEGPSRIRVGMLLDGRAPAREGAEILSSDGDRIGIVTSGGYSPSLKRPIAMGYIPPRYAKPETPVKLVVRKAPLDAQIVKLPFVEHTYWR
jgi:aminomethyltransferase